MQESSRPLPTTIGSQSDRFLQQRGAKPTIPRSMQKRSRSFLNTTRGETDRSVQHCRGQAMGSLNNAGVKRAIQYIKESTGRSVQQCMQESRRPPLTTIEGQADRSLNISEIRR